MVDEELKQKADEGIKQIKRKMFEDSIMKFMPFVCVLVIGLLVGVIFGIGLTNSMQDATIPNECALRNTDQIAWIPSLVTQSDLNENVVGIPVCIPFDKNTGNPVKMG